MRICVKL